MKKLSGAIFGGTLLIVIGIIFLLRNLGLLPYGIDKLWPILIILLGIWIMSSPWRKHG